MIGPELASAAADRLAAHAGALYAVAGDDDRSRRLLQATPLSADHERSDDPGMVVSLLRTALSLLDGDDRGDTLMAAHLQHAIDVADPAGDSERDAG